MTDVAVVPHKGQLSDERVTDHNGQTRALIPATDFGALIPTEQELAVYELMAKRAANTPWYSKLGGEPGIISIMLYARELGIQPMTAISGGLHNIQGHIEMSARMINAKIRQAGHLIRIVEHTDRVCRIQGKRRDTGEEHEASFTFEEAQKAKLVRQDSNWDKFPRDMLFARAISRLGRQLFADVIGTAYVEGEIQDMFGSDAIDVEPVKPAATRGRKPKTQRMLPPEEEAPEHKEQASEGETVDSTPPEQTEAPTPQMSPEKETTAEEGPAPWEQQPEQQQPEEQKQQPRHPEIVKFLGTVFAYLEKQRKMPQDKLDLAAKMICERFRVDHEEEVPVEKLEELTKFCRGPLLTELTK